MNRRKFFGLAGTYTGGTLLLPEFLYAYNRQPNLIMGNQSVVFIQLNGGNDGLNTFIPIDDPLYHYNRPNIGLRKEEIIAKNKGMAFHPALKDLADIQQNGDLSVIQNVGYPEPNRSHFRSREIWQTASGAHNYLDEGWLGRYLDLECQGHQPTAGVNIDKIDNLALKGLEPFSLTVRNPDFFDSRRNRTTTTTLSDNPQLDFVRKIANSITEGSTEFQRAMDKSSTSMSYPKTGLAKNLEWIARLIKGQLATKVYYTSLGGFDTHSNQKSKHERQLKELNDAVFSFYKDLKNARLLQTITIVIFSEFGRRVKDNGRGTDHGTAAPMFIIGGQNKGQIIGSNPDLADLDDGDLKYKIDFRSVYAAILENKLDFDYTQIGIQEKALRGLF